MLFIGLEDDRFFGLSALYEMTHFGEKLPLFVRDFGIQRWAWAG
jgi:hypothetical protein